MKPFSILFFLLLVLANCSKVHSDKPVKMDQPAFAKGADISWLQQMEASGYKFYNNDGAGADCFQIFKDHRINTIRLLPA